MQGNEDSIGHRSPRLNSAASHATKCPACGGGAALLVSAKDYNRQTTDEVFDYLRCEHCGLVFMSVIPGNLSLYYKGGYQQIPSGLEELRAIAAKERYRLEPILRYKTAGRLLEIGPWMGIFCCNAKDAGFDVSAIEMDPECVTFLEETVGVRAIQSTDPAKTLSAVTEGFDVIALWHCLEHLPNPWRLLEVAAQKLNPGGILLIAIPNIDSHEFRLFKEKWIHLDAPRHLYFYPARTLVAACEQNGLIRLEVTTVDTLSRALGAETWLKWATNNIPVKYVRGMMRKLALGWSRGKELREDSGSGMTAVFQKK